MKSCLILTQCWWHRPFLWEQGCFPTGNLCTCSWRAFCHLDFLCYSATSFPFILGPIFLPYLLVSLLCKCLFHLFTIIFLPPGQEYFLQDVLAVPRVPFLLLFPLEYLIAVSQITSLKVSCMFWLVNVFKYFKYIWRQTKFLTFLFSVSFWWKFVVEFVNRSGFSSAVLVGSRPPYSIVSGPRVCNFVLGACLPSFIWHWAMFSLFCIY